MHPPQNENPVLPMCRGPAISIEQGTHAPTRLLLETHFDHEIICGRLGCYFRFLLARCSLSLSACLTCLNDRMSVTGSTW